MLVSVTKELDMKCPVCPESVLVMTDKQGVEIDYCPSCRGVWLDRGELDKLLEKSAVRENATYSQGKPGSLNPRPPDFVDSDFRHKSAQPGYPRRKSWLSDIFD